MVCGGRDFSDQELFNHTMTEVRPWFEEYFCIIQGMARGADRMAHIWAFFQGCPSIAVPANWDFYDKKAGTVRNKWMLDFGLPDLVIAFPGHTGTANMVAQSRERGIDVYQPTRIQLKGL